MATEPEKVVAEKDSVDEEQSVPDAEEIVGEEKQEEEAEEEEEEEEVLEVGDGAEEVTGEGETEQEEEEEEEEEVDPMAEVKQQIKVCHSRFSGGETVV